MPDALPLVTSLLPVNPAALDAAAAATSQAAPGQPFRQILQQQGLDQGLPGSLPDALLAGEQGDAALIISPLATLPAELASGNPLPPGGKLLLAGGVSDAAPEAGEGQGGFSERLLALLRTRQGGAPENGPTRQSRPADDSPEQLAAAVEARLHQARLQPVNNETSNPTLFSARAEQQTDVSLNLQAFLPGLLRGAREAHLSNETAPAASGIGALQASSGAALGGYVNLATGAPALLSQDPSGTGLPQPAGQLGLPLQHDNWGQAFNERMVWMVSNQHSAQLRLNPAELGTIDVNIQIHDDEARIMFSTQHGAVREAIETALPRLRDMLEGQGLNLVDVNVNERHASPQHGDRGHGSYTPVSESVVVNDEHEPLPAQPPAQWLRAGLDVFA